MTSLKLSVVAAVSAAPLLLLTACGGSGSGSSSAPPSDADLVVIGKEYKFDKPEYTVKAGSVKIAYSDKGTLSHDLLVEGFPGSKIILGPGQTKTKTVTLPAGTYKLYCDLSGHEALGMKSVLVVQP